MCVEGQKPEIAAYPGPGTEGRGEKQRLYIALDKRYTGKITVMQTTS